MTTRTVAVNKTALATARDRRRQLDRDRDAQDERIEEMTALSLLALADLAKAEAARDAAAAIVADAVRDLLDEDVSHDRVAALLDVDIAEIRRLSKVTAPESRATNREKQVALRTRPRRGLTGAMRRVTAIAETANEDAAQRAD